MAYTIGQMYPIYTVPITLYYSSDRAAVRDKKQSSWISEKKLYEIIGVMWTDANGGWYQTQPATGGIPLYGLKNLGWVRDDDNISNSTISSFPNFSIDSSVTIAINRQSDKMTHKLDIYANNKLLRTVSNVGSSFVLALSSTEKQTIYKEYPTTQSGNITVKLTTYLNGQQIGIESSASAIVSFPATEAPKFTTNPTITVLNPVNGKAVIGKSSLKITSGTATPAVGTTIESYRAVVLGNSSNVLPYTTPIINQLGNVVVKVIATDTRGKTAEYTQTVVFYDYLAAGIGSFTSARITADGISFSASGLYDSAFNPPNFKILMQEKGLSTNKWIEKLSGQTIKSATNQWIVEGSLSGFLRTKSYYLKIVVTDNLNNSVENRILIATENVPFSAGKHGLGVGALFDNSRKENLQIGTDGIYTNGRLQIQADKTDQYGLWLNNLSDYWYPSLIGISDKEGEQVRFGWGVKYKNFTVQLLKSNKNFYITDTDVIYDSKSLLNQNPIEVSTSNYTAGYIKHKNGILEQWATFSSTNPQGKLTYALPFINNPTLIIQVECSNVWARITQNITASTPTDFSYSVFNSADGSQLGEFKIHYRATGKWK